MSQDLHPDFKTSPANTDYFFLGSGKIQAAIQWSRRAGCTPLGLLISDPEHFSRKWSTHLFHPEYGLERTMLTVFVDGVRYTPDNELRVAWDRGCSEPIVKATWRAGDCSIIELFRTAPDSATITRDVYVLSSHNRHVEVEVALYASPALYSRFDGDEQSLRASGYDKIRIGSNTPGAFNERFLRVPLDTHGSVSHVTFDYTLGETVPEAAGTRYRREQEYWEGITHVLSTIGCSELTEHVAELYRVSCYGLRAAIAESGRFDASIWQYNFEWSGDASMVSEALVYSGQFELARKVLVNVLTRLTNDEGMAMESSRFRGGQHAELNNNGEILAACATYVDWTGDFSLIREHYTRITAIAEYLLRPEFFDASTGLLSSSRDIWERMEAMGILPGYDVAHQTFGIHGLHQASRLAGLMGDDEHCERWKAAAATIRDSFLHHPTRSFVENGRIIKRRLKTGAVQYDLYVDHAKGDESYFKSFVPTAMPLGSEGYGTWEPDVSECFPICFDVVKGSSDIAKRTLALMETLWSQAWDGGGYGRYNVLSEPDSPGPWPFATGYVAAAYLEAGMHDKAERAIQWLIQRAGAGGSWFEFYGERPTPPLPPTGIIVWGWAQFITLVVKHILAARVIDNELHIAPRMAGFTGEIRFSDSRVTF